MTNFPTQLMAVHFSILVEIIKLRIPTKQKRLIPQLRSFSLVKKWLAVYESAICWAINLIVKILLSFAQAQQVECGLKSYFNPTIYEILTTCLDLWRFSTSIHRVIFQQLHR